MEGQIAELKQVFSPFSRIPFMFISNSRLSTSGPWKSERYMRDVHVSFISKKEGGEIHT